MRTRIRELLLLLLLLIVVVVSAPVQTCPGPHPTSYTMGTEFFPGVKRPGRGVDHPPRSCAEVEGRVEIYICSPFGPSCPVLGRPLPLPLVVIPTKMTQEY